jgi:YesN/AraC family two-component response regulator
MFFESEHSLNENEFKLWNSKRISFPIHIHRSFEYFKQIHGSTEIMINDQKYVLKKGESVLVFPFQPHSYVCIEDGEIQMSIFSPEIVSSFYKRTKSRIHVNNQFICRLPESIEIDNIFHKKSVAYFICGEFEKDREYIERSKDLGDDLFASLLIYADHHFRDPCLLRDAAVYVGYDYAYISKFFKRKVGMSFREYVNCIRILESKQLLENTSKSISEIGELCGFSSTRAFDREFYRQTGMTPSEYKKSGEHKAL